MFHQFRHLCVCVAAAWMLNKRNYFQSILSFWISLSVICLWYRELYLLVLRVCFFPFSRVWYPYQDQTMNRGAKDWMVWPQEVLSITSKGHALLSGEPNSFLGIYAQFFFNMNYLTPIWLICIITKCSRRTVVSIPCGPSALAVKEAAWGLARYAAISQVPLILLISQLLQSTRDVIYNWTLPWNACIIYQHLLQEI